MADKRRACNPFALYIAATFGNHAVKLTFKERTERMKSLATAWNSMSEDEKTPWRERSQSDFQEKKRRKLSRCPSTRPSPPTPRPDGEGSAAGKAGDERGSATGASIPTSASASSSMPPQSAACSLQAACPLQKQAACPLQKQAACPLLTRTPRPTLLGGRYRIDEERSLGEGAYGTVVRVAELGTNRRLAAKIFLADAVPSAQCEHRVHAGLQLNPHPAFQRLIDFEFGDPMAWFVMPLGVGSLADHLRRESLEDEAIVGASEQIRSGVSHLHANVGFLHLDLKPANILFCSRTMHIHIIDFGLSRTWPLQPHSAEQRINGSRVCTPPYRPPELFSSKRLVAAEVLSPAVDAWSVGVIVVEVATRAPLFWSRDKPDWEMVAAERIRGFKTLDKDRMAKVPYALRLAVSGFLHPSPRQRRGLRQPL
jgi:hypothetical protein